MQLKYIECPKVNEDARTPPLHTSFTGNIYLEDGSRVSLIGTQMSGEIIRAVNCHEDLLNACKSVSSAADHEVRIDLAAIHYAILEVRAALKKVEEADAAA